MTDFKQLNAFRQLKLLIEEHLQWGESRGWNNYDFDKLAGMVQDKTGVMLSVSTLKRVFGRVEYKSTPSLTTLNTLAQFVGFEDWRVFMNSLEDEESITSRNEIQSVTENQRPAKKGRHFTWEKIIFFLAFLILVGFIVVNFFSREPERDPSAYSFSSKTILTEGVPNSVVFDYDASVANEQDSVYISQSWDTRRKALVNKNNRHHSSIYYYPGYFRAKLIVGSDIILEHDIHIKTEGWLGLVESNKSIEPLYFKQADILEPRNTVAVTKEVLDKYHIKPNLSPPKIRFFNQKDIKGIMTNDFTFETELKNDYVNGTNPCQRVEVLLHAKNDVLIVPLVNKGCIGDLYLFAYGYNVHSNKEDLSGFGCNPKEWTKLKVICKDGVMKFYIDDGHVYTAQISNKPTEIVGIQYRFNGLGAVRNTWLKGATDKVIF
ncbi:hypothetical protein OOZ15_11250 [Galbibacter sp. EGI 63066]|uniref:hypothetical protein n=1 Tax=Galbibacter sp. EGI 63066 TaxID=2993559 RepID=UPI00224923FC|nr:hypothetical protein [Galbibacter sp. EGI 63066]MCX2680518.1 hypothetical protein [Galbibacter sp. EGI 63066]